MECVILGLFPTSVVATSLQVGSQCSSSQEDPSFFVLVSDSQTVMNISPSFFVCSASQSRNIAHKGVGYDKMTGHDDCALKSLQNFTMDNTQS